MQISKTNLAEQSSIPDTRFKTQKKKKSKNKEKNFDLDIILFFENLGCGIVEYSKDFSLVAGTTNTIDNPNIDTDIKTVKEKLSADISFPNENDPFFEVSSEKAQNFILSDSNKISNTSSLATKSSQLKIDLTEINLSSDTDTSSTIKQFSSLTKKR